MISLCTFSYVISIRDWNPLPAVADFTPEVVKTVMDKEIPGIMELIRIKYGQEKPNALLSRGVAGVMGNSLIYSLPGSVKAVNEYMSEITKTLQHLIFI